MIQKIIIIVIAAIIIGEMGYFISQSLSLFPKNEKNEEETSDDILIFLRYLSKILHWVNFSAIQTTEMQWNIVKNKIAEEIILNGKGFMAENVTDYDYRDIQDFFGKVNIGFKTDILNIGAGPLTEYIGYKRDNMVCTVAGQIQNYKEVQNKEKEPIWYVVVKCSELPVSH